MLKQLDKHVIKLFSFPGNRKLVVLIFFSQSEFQGLVYQYWYYHEYTFSKDFGFFLFYLRFLLVCIFLSSKTCEKMKIKLLSSTRGRTRVTLSPGTNERHFLQFHSQISRCVVKIGKEQDIFRAYVRFLFAMKPLFTHLIIVLLCYY